MLKHLTENQLLEGNHLIFSRNFRQNLYDLYWNQALSTYEIADRFALSQMSIWSYLKRMNIPRRPARKQIKRKLVDTLSGGDE